MKRAVALIESWLRWSERYTRTDMTYVAHGGSWMLLGKAAGILAGLALSVAFANLLEPEKYGNYRYVIALTSLASVLSLSGIVTAVGRAAARGAEGSIRYGARLALISSIGTATALFLGAGYYYLNGNSTLAIGLLIAGACSPIIASASLYENYLVGTRRFGAKTLYGIARNLAPTLVLVPALFITHNPATLTAIYFVVTTGACVLAYKDSIRRYPPNDIVDKRLFVQSAHFSTMNVLSTVATHLDKVLVFSQLGGTQLAIYSFAQLAPQQLRDMGGMIANLAFPKITQRPFAELKKTLPYHAWLLFILGCLLAALYAVIAPFLFSTFFPAYMESVLFSQVLALSIVAVFPGILYSQALIGHMKKKELYILSIAPAIVRICIMASLISFLGIWAVIIGMIGYYAVGTALLLFLFAQASDTSLPSEEQGTIPSQTPEVEAPLK